VPDTLLGPEGSDDTSEPEGRLPVRTLTMDEPPAELPRQTVGRRLVGEGPPVF
jgi:hypothetical protein